MRRFAVPEDMARGQLSPIIYFENRDGYKILAPYDKGKPEIARWVYEKKFKALGFEWRESRTLLGTGGWYWLQDELIKQENRDAEGMKERGMEAYDAGRRRTAAVLMQRRSSSSCTPYERDCIDAWLKQGEQKRRAFEKRMYEKNHFLWALNYDSGTKIEDRITGIPEKS
jgi:hypothetical protein